MKKYIVYDERIDHNQNKRKNLIQEVQKMAKFDLSNLTLEEIKERYKLSDRGVAVLADYMERKIEMYYNTNTGWIHMGTSEDRLVRATPRQKMPQEQISYKECLLRKYRTHSEDDYQRAWGKYVKMNGFDPYAYDQATSYLKEQDEENSRLSDFIESKTEDEWEEIREKGGAPFANSDGCGIAY